MSNIDFSLLPDFIVEAEEHLEEMEALLLKLVQQPDDLEVLNDIFRPIHTIKGGAQYIGLEKISHLSHRLEDLLDLLRDGSMASSSEIIETLITATDRISLLVKELETTQSEESDVDDLVTLLSLLLEGDTATDLTDSLQASAISDEIPGLPLETEDDQELYAIFESHLQEHYGELTSIIEQLSLEGDPSVLLEQFMTVLDQMRSSANYMDYLDLVHRYQIWKSDVEAVLQAVQQGEPLQLDVLSNKMRELAEQFPALKTHSSLEFDEQTLVAEEQGDVSDAVSRAFDSLSDSDVSGSVADAFAESSDGDVSGSVADVFAEFSDGDVSGSVADAFAESSDVDVSGSVADAFAESSDVDVSGSVADVFAEFSDVDVSGSVADAFTEEEPATAAVDESQAAIDFSLLPDFIIEAEEHLEEMEELLLELMQQPDDRDVLNSIFRTVHTIKGGAQYIGLSKISHLSHVLEDLLDLLRTGEIESSFDIVETLISARDRFLLISNELKQYQEEQSEIDDLISTLNQWLPSSEKDAVVVAPVVTSTTSADSASLEPYQDDEDEELYEIFMTHLQEQYDELVALVAAIGSGTDKIESLANSQVIVEKMSSSANYMGYVDLVQRYKIWINEIKTAHDDLSVGTDVSTIFMQLNLDELALLFPQLRAQVEPSGKTFVPNIKVVVNAPVAGGLQDTLTKKQTNERTAALPVDNALNEQLFDSLSGALDRSMPMASSDDDETLNQIFDELVSGEPETIVKPAVVADVKPAAMEKPRKQPKPKPEASVKKKKQAPESKIKKSVRVDAEKIDVLMNQVGELVVDRSYFFQLMTEMRNLQRHLKDTLGMDQKEVKMIRAFTYRLGEAIASLGRTSNDLQEGVMKMRMLPISQIFNRYPRLVHDLTRNSDKKVNLVVKGEDTELDRMIVEELSDPLIHIIRNAVDHGIESGSERSQSGKEDEGTLILEAYQESNHIVIEVTDDGKGIDPNKIRQKAMEKGLYSEEELEQFSNDDLIALVLTAGFSTADKITGTSGRGVGMDVVKKNIEKLNGTLEIDSRVGIGTQMRLKIPLTLAIIHALMVRVSEDLFTIPLANVDETVRIFKSDTSIIEGVEVINLRGDTLPIFRLSTLFGEQRETESDKSFVVIVSVAGQRTGFVVDELLGQEEVVIKPLADYVQDKSGFSGATIIGDGRISLILDTYEMVRMTANKQAIRQRAQTDFLKSKIRRTGRAVETAVIEGVAE